MAINSTAPYEIRNNTVFSENDITLVGEPYVSYWSSESGKGSVEIIPSDEGYILKISGNGTSKYRFDINDEENEYHFEYYFDKDNNTVVINRLP